MILFNFFWYLVLDNFPSKVAAWNRWGGKVKTPVDGLYSSNKYAKNLCKRTVLLQLIIKNVVTCFFWNTVYVSSLVLMVLYTFNFFLLNSLLYLLVRWSWWDWQPLTWFTNHCPSVLWHCWLGHLTSKIVPEMIYSVSSGMLKPTVLYLSDVYCWITVLLWIYVLLICLTRTKIETDVCLSCMSIVCISVYAWWLKLKCCCVWLELIITYITYIMTIFDISTFKKPVCIRIIDVDLL